MLIAEYDYAADIAAQRQEAWEDAWGKAWKQASEETWDKAWDKASKELPEKILKQTALNMLKDKVSIDAISKYTGLPFEVIRTLKEKH